MSTMNLSIPVHHWICSKYGFPHLVRSTIYRLQRFPVTRRQMRIGHELDMNTAQEHKDIQKNNHQSQYHRINHMTSIGAKLQAYIEHSYIFDSLYAGRQRLEQSPSRTVVYFVRVMEMDGFLFYIIVLYLVVCLGRDMCYFLMMTLRCLKGPTSPSAHGTSADSCSATRDSSPLNSFRDIVTTDGRLTVYQLSNAHKALQFPNLSSGFCGSFSRSTPEITVIFRIRLVPVGIHKPKVFLILTTAHPEPAGSFVRDLCPEESRHEGISSLCQLREEVAKEEEVIH